MKLQKFRGHRVVTAVALASTLSVAAPSRAQEIDPRRDRTITLARAKAIADSVLRSNAVELCRLK